MTACESGDVPFPIPAGSGHRQLANFRDLGGLRLTGGGVTRQGVLYRSDAPFPGDEVPAGAPPVAPSRGDRPAFRG